jgi:hypothetical protein
MYHSRAFSYYSTDTKPSTSCFRKLACGCSETLAEHRTTDTARCYEIDKIWHRRTLPGVETQCKNRLAPPQPPRKEILPPLDFTVWP